MTHIWPPETDYPYHQKRKPETVCHLLLLKDKCFKQLKNSPSVARVSWLVFFEMASFLIQLVSAFLMNKNAIPTPKEPIRYNVIQCILGAVDLLSKML